MNSRAAFHPERGRENPGEPGARKSLGQRGVALIITLGLLSLLLLLAFTFSVSMRTEQVAAHAYGDSVQAREALFKGFAYAARDISRYVDIYPAWRVREPAGVLHMPGGKLKVAGPDEKRRVRDLDYALTNHLPAAVRAGALGTNIFWYSIFELLSSGGYEILGWTYKPGPGGTPVKDDPILGDYWDVRPIKFDPIVVACLTTDCSGFLDPHIVDRAARGLGQEPAEIQPSNTLDVAMVAAAAAASVDPSKPAESFHELVMRTGIDDAPYCFPYSHALEGEYLELPGDLARSDLKDAAYIAGDETDLRPRADDIRDSFKAAGITHNYTYTDPLHGGTIDFVPGQMCAWLTTNLIDYVDSGDRPESLAQPCQEAVPMLNEIRLMAIYRCYNRGSGSIEFSVQHQFEFEIWYPHTGRTGIKTFDVYADPVQVTGGPWPDPPAAKLDGPPHSMGCPDITNFPVDVRWPGFGSKAKEHQFGPTAATNFPTYNHARYTVEVPLLHVREGLGAGVEVDEVASLALPVEVTVSNIPSSLTTPSVGYYSNTWECLDPRFNWTTNGLWREAAVPTFGRTNTWTLSYRATHRTPTSSKTSPTHNPCDPDTLMYCANDELKTVGELGYLVYAPWKTITLYDRTGSTNLHRVLDTFTLVDKETNPAVKGKVNPNTPYADVLASVFMEMPINQYPELPVPATVPRLTPEEAGLLASNIVAYTRPAPGTYNFFRERSQLGNATNVFNLATLYSIGATNEFQREAILRNSADLFNTRQQVFTTVLTAGYVRGGDSGDAVEEDVIVASERQALALFARDAWTGDTFIRFFKLIRE